MCSPLEGIALSELADTIANPFNPPKPGSDDAHQGVDFAHLSGGDRIALEGLPVRTVLDGQVAVVINERFPFGNAIILETPLEGIPANWFVNWLLPTVAPTLNPNTAALTCPGEARTLTWDLEKRSLYLLYAHLKEPPGFRIGEELACGQTLGAIGMTGNALNPHLHLEARVGPAGVRFASMAHYEPSATAEEMDAYCTWRVSELFQLVDPMRVLGK